MKRLTSVREALNQRRRTAGVALAIVLALALGVGLTVLTGALSRSDASGEHSTASGFATQDLYREYSRQEYGQAMRALAERCGETQWKYWFDRNELSYGPGEGSAVTAGGRAYYYLLTEDDDEYAPPYCRILIY
jgi:hypothetical protein